MNSTWQGLNRQVAYDSVPIPIIKDESNIARSAIMPGTFQDSESDSDIEIISPRAFNDNGRYVHYASLHPQNQIPSLLPDPRMHGYAGSGFGNVNSHSIPQFSAAAEAACHAKLQRGLGGHLSLANGGSVLPPLIGMSTQPPTHLPSTKYAGGPGSNVYTNHSISGAASPSGPGSMLNQSPLSHIFQSGGYKFDSLGSMIDIYGNPIIEGMSELNNALNGRLAEFNDYVSDPRRTAQEIQDLLENIHPDVEIPKENREGTPDGLRYPLYEHQKLALTWLKQMEEGTNNGGILADDMGLGKTISALALILSRPSKDRRRKV